VRVRVMVRVRVRVKVKVRIRVRREEKGKIERGKEGKRGGKIKNAENFSKEIVAHTF
jgi:hypothetical protein